MKPANFRSSSTTSTRTAERVYCLIALHRPGLAAYVRQRRLRVAPRNFPPRPGQNSGPRAPSLGQSREKSRSVRRQMSRLYWHRCCPTRTGHVMNATALVLLRRSVRRWQYARAVPRPLSGRATISRGHVRRILTLLLSCSVIAATAQGGAVRCVSATASLGNSHGCCGDEQMLSPAAPAACCAISQARQPGPVEPRVGTPQGNVSCDARVAWLDAGDGSLRKPGVRPPPRSTASSVPIYLQHLTLLI